jgi:hypothetical protein
MAADSIAWCCSAPVRAATRDRTPITTSPCFSRTPGELWDELGILSHITTGILNDTGAVISAKPFPAGAYADRSPLMHEIRAEGRDL